MGSAACTLIGVAVLGYDRQLVEIEVVAVAPPAGEEFVGDVGLAVLAPAARRRSIQIAIGVEMA